MKISLVQSAATAPLHPIVNWNIYKNFKAHRFKETICSSTSYITAKTWNSAKQPPHPKASQSLAYFWQSEKRADHWMRSLQFYPRLFIKVSLFSNAWAHAMSRLTRDHQLHNMSRNFRERTRKLNFSHRRTWIKCRIGRRSLTKNSTSRQVLKLDMESQKAVDEPVTHREKK